MPRATRRSAQAADFESSSTASPPSRSLSLTRPNSAGTSRSRRAAAQVSARSTHDASKQSIRLTVKAPPSRLREVTTNSSNSRRERLGRSSKRAPIIDKSESSEEDAEGDEVEEDDMPEDEEEEEEDEGEDVDEEDEDEDEELPAPRIRINGPSAARKPSPGQLLKQNTATKSVEEKEMQEASSDEELSSELDDEDAEGDEEDEEEAEEDEMELDEDGANETINSAMIGDEELESQGEDSESGTPDPAKLTRRQRGDADSDLMALSNEAQKKKFFTAEQITMRRAEMARRRKDLSDKRNQNEKEDTLRRLLHKPAPKRRSRAQMMADAERDEFGTPGLEGEEAKANKLFVRTVMRANGTTVSVPEEWLGTPAGTWYENTKKQDSTQTSTPQMVQVID